MVFWLALPILGEQLLNACVTWNDAILAGRLSPAAMGAVGLAGYVGWLMTMLFGLVSIGATAIVARSIGAAQEDAARRTTNQSFVLAVIMGLAATSFVYLVAPLLADLQNMRGETASIAIWYMRIDGFGFAGAAISFALAACLRGAGDTRTPMYILGAVNVFNLGASWILTFGLESLSIPFSGIGVNGIAMGTALARWFGAAWVLMILVRGRQGLRLERRLLRPDFRLVFRILRIGVPAAIDGALIFTGHFIYMMIVNRVRTDMPQDVLYAAHIVGVRIESLSYLPPMAWALAAATFVGQNLGAGQPRRARRAAHEAVLQATVLLVGSGLLYFFCAESLYRLLSNDPRVWACGVPVVRWMAPFQLAMAPIIVYIGALRGAGDTRTPMLINSAGLGLVRIPVSALLGIHFGLGLIGAWTGMYVDLTIRAIVTAWWFHTGRWERLKV